MLVAGAAVRRCPNGHERVALPLMCGLRFRGLFGRPQGGRGSPMRTYPYDCREKSNIRAFFQWLGKAG